MAGRVQEHLVAYTTPAGDSIDQALSSWIGDHVWKVDKSEDHAIVVVTGVSEDGSKFTVDSSFGWFEVTAVYDHGVTTLSDIVIKLDAPTISSPVVVATASSYSLSTDDGAAITFNIDNGYISGSLSFKHVSAQGGLHVFVTFKATLPWIEGTEEGVYDISPTQGTEGASILAVTQSETVDPAQLALFSGRLKEVITPEGLVVEHRGLSKASNSKSFTFYIPPIFEVQITIDITTKKFTATLYAKVGPLKQKITTLTGTLKDGCVRFEIKTVLATGYIEFCLNKGKDGKYELTIKICLKIKGLSEKCGQKTFNLPF